MKQALTVQVPHDQLFSFKKASAKLFEIISLITGSPPLPKRKGIDVLAKALGYTSHSDLVRQSKGYTTPKGGKFSIIPSDQAPNIATRLSAHIPNLSTGQALDALMRLSGCFAPKMSGSDIAGFMFELKGSSDNEYDTIINPFYQAVLSKSFDAVNHLVKTIDWHNVSDETKGTVLAFCVVEKHEDALRTLLRNGVSPNLSVQSRNWQPPLAMAIKFGSISTQFLLVEHGANVNEPMFEHYKYSMPFFAAECKAHSLLNYCIDKGLLETPSGLLEFAVNVGDLPTICAVYRTASIEDKLSAMKVSVQAGVSCYYIALMMKLDPEIALTAPINDYFAPMEFRTVLPSALFDTLRVLSKLPVLCEKLDPIRVVLSIVSCVILNWHGDEESRDKLAQEYIFNSESRWSLPLTHKSIQQTVEAVKTSTLTGALMNFLEVYGLIEISNQITDNIDSWDVPVAVKKVVNNWGVVSIKSQCFDLANA